MLLRRSSYHSSLIFLFRLKVKEEAIALQIAACQETRGSAVTHRSVSPYSRACSLLGLINIFQPAYRFGEYFSVFRLQMCCGKVLGNSCSLNRLATGSLLLILVCCSYSVVSHLFNHVLTNEAGELQETSWDCFPSLPASTEQLEVN